jgi:hypothetical protein
MRLLGIALPPPLEHPSLPSGVRSLAWPFACAGAAAQAPGKPIRVVVPFSAGGQIDSATRMIADHLAHVARPAGRRRVPSRRRWPDRG